MKYTREVIEESTIAMAQSVLQNAIDDSGLNYSQIAKKLHVDRATITQILGRNFTIRSMAKILFVCGYEIRFNLEKINNS